MQVSPILPVSLAIIATSFTFLLFLLGEQLIGTLLTAAQPYFTEDALAVSTTLRYLWLIIPVVITIGLWIWAVLTVTRRQVITAPGGYY